MMMKTKIYFCIILGALLVYANCINSQTFTCKQTYHPTEDAYVFYLTNQNSSFGPTNSTNHSSSTAVPINIGTWGGSPGMQRGFLNFDLSAAYNASRSKINEIKLYLYNSGVLGSTIGHASQSSTKPNKVSVFRVTGPWQENVITWNNQPGIDAAYSSESAVFSGTYTSLGYENATINLNNVLLQNNKLKANFHGICLKQYQEDINTRYRIAFFATSRLPDSRYWPRLEVVYEFPLCAINFNGVNSFSVYSNDDMEMLFDNIIYRWTINGNVYYGNNIQAQMDLQYDVNLQVSIINNSNDRYSYTLRGTYVNDNFSTFTCSQTYYPTDDAYVFYLTNQNSSFGPTNSTNHSSNTAMPINIGTWGGSPGMQRGFLNFDLSAAYNTSLSNINGVKLYLYNSGALGSTIGHASQSSTKPNKVSAFRVTGPWQENIITWNNQPGIDAAYSSESAVFSGTYTRPGYENATINLNNVLLQNNRLKTNFHGICLRQYQEDINTPYRIAFFATSRLPDSRYWPKLEVEYNLVSPSISFDGYNTFKVVRSTHLEGLFDNIVYKWTINGNVYYGESVNVILQQSNSIVLNVQITNNSGYLCEHRINGTLDYFIPNFQDLYGNFTYKNIIVDNESIVLNTDNDKINEKFIVYPNPTDNFITIEYNGNNIIKEYTIVDQSGSIIKKGNNFNNINVSDLSPSVYLIQITDDIGKQHTISFVKN